MMACCSSETLLKTPRRMLLYFGEEALDLVEPRGGCGRKVEMNARMLFQPGLHGLGLVGGVIVHDQVKIEMLGCVALNDPKEAQKLLRSMPRQALADHLAGLDVQGGEQGRRAIALVVVVRHGSGASLLHRQTWLRAIERLDLALLVDAQHQRLVGGLR